MQEFFSSATVLNQRLVSYHAQNEKQRAAELAGDLRTG
jgi:hypothetical protein